MFGSHFGWACSPLALTAESISWAIGRIFFVPHGQKTRPIIVAALSQNALPCLSPIVEAGLRAGVTHIFLEQEPPFKEVPAMEAAEIDYRALKSFLSSELLT
jgi:hypothetical protein